MVNSHPIQCDVEYALNDNTFDEFLEFTVDSKFNIVEEAILPHPKIEADEHAFKPLRRCTSSIPEFGMVYPMQNDVVVATSSFSYLDILPPPTHVQFKNKMHKIRFNLDGRRYIIHDGKDILLRDIAVMC
jgi:hypothetical protein